MAAPSDNVFFGDLPEGITKEDCEAIFAQYGTVTSCRVNMHKPGSKASCLVRFASVDEAKWVVENLNGNLAEGLAEPIVARFANAPGTSWGGKDAGKGWGGGKDSGKGWGGKDSRAEPYSAGKGKGKGAEQGWGQESYGKAGGKDGKGKGKTPAPASFGALLGAVKKQGLLGDGAVPHECQVYVQNLPADTTDVDLYKLFAPFGAIAPTGAKALMGPDGGCKGIGFVDFVDPTCAEAAIATLNNFTLPEGGSIQLSTKADKSGKGKGKW